MNGLFATVLRIELEVLEPLGLGVHPGPALRGALFESLRDNLNVCFNKHLPTCQPCDLRQVCPLSGLLATVDDASPRGLDVPRPMTIQPPLDGRRVYRPGDRINFGVTLFGEGSRYVPYLVLAARELERSGLGLYLDPRRRASRRAGVRLGAVEAVHPMTGQRQLVCAPAESTVRPCDLRVTFDDVGRRAGELSGAEIALEFLTPTRLIDAGRVAPPARFEALVARLLDRIAALTSHYAAGISGVDTLALVDHARTIEVADDRTCWIDLESRSSRTGRWNPVGGYVGRITYRGDLSPLLPSLVWGTLTHIGKSATRGNGWYRIVAA